MNKKLLLSATALALVSSVLDNDAMAMRRADASATEDSYISELRQKLAPKIAELSPNGEMPSGMKEVVDNYALQYGDTNRINEVHNQLSLEGKQGHVLLLEALSKSPHLENVSLSHIMQLYPELNDHYLIRGSFSTTSLHDQAFAVASVKPIYDVFPESMPADIKHRSIQAAQGVIPLEELRKAVPDYHPDPYGLPIISSEDSQSYIAHLLRENGVDERDASDMARRAMEAKNKPSDRDYYLRSAFRGVRW
ncbi:MAG: hypothetical protein LBL30_00585 [Holosporales bacterium]|jgi:hypothetical protein|nr:hypothetical protein [Holosporales bacterium]